MEIRKPSYYDSFRCIAGKCPDSCCHEWSVQVDDASAAFYRSCPGDLGLRLRQALTEEDGQTVMQIQAGRCPMWREDGLCRIQAELGESALCHVCRTYPRLRHDYGDFVELGLELSCPEAARLILTSPAAPAICEFRPGSGEHESSPEMEILLQTREEALALLSDPRFSVPQALAILLLYGYEAQARLDGEEAVPFDPMAALESAAAFAKPAQADALPRFFSTLEILTDRWKARLQAPCPGPWAEELRAMARYMVQRYWLQAISDFDLICRVKFAVASCLLVHILGGSALETAQLFSKEVENDAENVDAVLDGAYTAAAMTDQHLLGLLLQKDGKK